MDLPGLWDQMVVVNVFVYALVFLYEQISLLGVASWGLAIAVFTVVVKTLTLPLTLKSLKSMKRMQQVQPKMAALQKQFKGDKERLMQEQMALYKEHGVNPLGGCLPMIVQMPIWLALYGALLHLANPAEPWYEEFAKPFLWIPNLGQPEFLFENFPSQLPILAVLTGVTQWITTRMAMQPTTDPQQQTMNSVMQIMPFMFIWFSLTVPAGLVLYWVVSNVYQMVQQYFITGWGQLIPQGASATVAGKVPGRGRAKVPPPVAPAWEAGGQDRPVERPVDAPAEPRIERATKQQNSGRRRRNKRR